MYWADEVLINSDWIHAQQWRGNRLIEWELYQEAVAGDKFFTKAEAARGQSRDALETFFLCVTLGFQGRFALERGMRPRWRGRGSVHPELLAWGKETYRIVRTDLDRFLPRDDLQNDGEPPVLPGHRLLLRASILIGITVVATIASWIASTYLVP